MRSRAKPHRSNESPRPKWRPKTWNDRGMDPRRPLWGLSPLLRLFSVQKLWRYDCPIGRDCFHRDRMRLPAHPGHTGGNSDWHRTLRSGEDLERNRRCVEVTGEPPVGVERNVVLSIENDEVSARLNGRGSFGRHTRAAEHVSRSAGAH